MIKITYEDKEDIREQAAEPKYKVDAATLNEIKNVVNAATNLLIKETYQLGSEGGSESYELQPGDSGTYFKAFNTFNHSIMFNAASLTNDDNAAIVVVSNSNGGIVQITNGIATGVTFNNEVLGEYYDGVLTIPQGKAIVIKRNTGNNFDVIGSLVEP